ncbi:alpha/beta hydrolase [Eremococcus coleocola]|uniref:alpha/beta hydrolase n=1 Tax=Eremococcus coleocola TaxID=88132 RepID=UPI00041D2C88|nr:alpha/beta hydrolase [Eremococcus coleocola]
MTKLKRRLSILGILVYILTLLGLGIGNYFVDYALVYQNGGQDRQVQAVNPNQEAEDKQVDQIKAQAEDFIAQTYQGDTAVKEWQVKSQDGLDLVGHYFPQKTSSHKWVILVHGYQSNEAETHALIPHFQAAGYHILTIAMRGQGVSQGDYIGMGYLDKEDLLTWINRVVDQDPDSQIVLHGTSMGGATVLFTAGLDLPKNVTKIVDDAGYSSVYDIFASELKARFSLPAFPVLDLSNIVAQAKAGYSLKAADVKKYVAKAHVPILIIHTENDDFVPVAMAHELYQAIPGSKEIKIFPKGGHAHARYLNQNAYYQTLFDFLDQEKGDQS